MIWVTLPTFEASEVNNQVGDSWSIEKSGQEYAY